MRKNAATKLSVIGAAIGLVLAGAAVAPAYAMEAPSASSAVAATTSCGGFAGLTATGSELTVNGIAMRGGDVITANVSPAVEADRIRLVGSIGLNIFITDASATAGHAFRAPVDGVYNLSWSLQTAGAYAAATAWTFSTSCSTNPYVPETTPTKPGNGKGAGKGGGKGKG